MLKIGIEDVGDLLHQAVPTAVILADVIPHFLSGNFIVGAQKVGAVAGILFLQNRTTSVLKHWTKKPRPSFPHDLKSFPSGHMMIAALCATRVFFAYQSIVPKLLSLACVGITALSRYIPGKHDVVDLTAGGLLGIGFGTIWNSLLPLPSR